MTGLELTALKPLAGLLTKPLGDLYSLATGQARTVIKKWQAAGQLDQIAQQIANVELVRTITSLSPVPLSMFYFPSSVVPGLQHGRNVPKSRVSSLDDLSLNKNVMIAGTVGQGKSVFMRYLCLQELKAGKRIPVFVELREIDETRDLTACIKHKLTLLGFDDLTDEILAFLLSGNALTIFLDGFDEIKREYVIRTQQALQVLLAKYAKTRWVISSRFGSLGQHLNIIPDLQFFSLAPLHADDLEPFLEKLGVEKDHRQELVGAVASSSSKIQEVLTTPLMVTLLNMTFGTSVNIPATLHEFYEEMFTILVSRHDGTKPSYSRQKVTSLTNGELQSCFEHFCYFSKQFGVSLSDEHFATCVRKVLKVTGHSFTVEGFRTDLTDTVCLMMPDGLKTAFIHKSIQEFFGAYFIKHHENQEQVVSLYRGFRGQRLITWQQEVGFLRQVDPIRFAKYMQLPSIDAFLGSIAYKTKAQVKISKASFTTLISSLNVLVASRDAKGEVDWRTLKNANYVTTIDNPRLDFVVHQYLSAIRVYVYPFLNGFSELEAAYAAARASGVQAISLQKYLKLNDEAFQIIYRKTLEFANKMQRERERVGKFVADRDQNYANGLDID